jgi:GDP-L-fucose synthase
VKKLLFLGSSCIFPKLAAQPMTEEMLLKGPLEPTNEWYAVAKIAGIKLCEAYRRQFNDDFISVMPTNLYGPGDNYDLQNSHVLPALIRKFHEAKVRGDQTVTLWGTGAPRREFLYSDDMAAACVYLMSLDDEAFDKVLNEEAPFVLSGTKVESKDNGSPPLINIGCGEDLTIRELAEKVRGIVGFTGRIAWDSSKPDGTPRKLLDVSRLLALGWRQQIDLAQGIADAYRDFLRAVPGKL